MKGISNLTLRDMPAKPGGYHLEMKGISNPYLCTLKSWRGGYHLEMKGIYNLGVTLTMVLRWWLSSQIRVFYANS